jgi:hypothetical protein
MTGTMTIDCGRVVEIHTDAPIDPYAPILVNGVRYEPATARDDFERECG